MGRIILFALIFIISINGQNILSLENGNWWKYDYYENGNLIGAYTKTVVGDTIINDKKYAKISIDNTYLSSIEYWGCDSSKFYHMGIDKIIFFPIAYDREELPSIEDYFGTEYNVQVRYDSYSKDDKSIIECIKFAEYLGPVETSVSSSTNYSEASGDIRKSVLVSAFIDDKHINSLAEIKKLNDIQDSYILFDNYPNPFNPTTNISYYLKKENYIKIKIYNSIGEFIKCIYDEESAAGEHTVQFDAADLPSGMYYYQLYSSDFITTKKMILLK